MNGTEASLNSLEKLSTEHSSNLNPQQYEAWRMIIPALAKSYSEIIATILSLGGNATVGEISQVLGKQLNQVSGRLTELRRKKIICDSGMVRHNARTKRNMTVWSLDIERATAWHAKQLKEQDK